MSRSGLPSAAVKYIKPALYEACAIFDQAAARHPGYLLVDSDGSQALTFEEVDAAVVDLSADPFGRLAKNAHELFITAAQVYIERLPDLSAGDQQLLLNRFNVSKNGIGVLAIFLELVSLVCINELPDVHLSADETATVAADSYGFIDQIVKSGTGPGSAIVNSWIRPQGSTIGGWRFRGTVNGGAIANPSRLSFFGLAEANNALGVKVAPVNLDQNLDVWLEKAEPGMLRVDCMAEVNKNPETSLPYTRQIFDTMLEHTRGHIYPDFIPFARNLLRPNAEPQ